MNLNEQDNRHCMCTVCVFSCYEQIINQCKFILWSNDVGAQMLL